MIIPNHLFVAASAWASKFITAFSVLIVLRLLTDSLSLDEYAVFALLTGLSGWFLLLDLGVGVGLQNRISLLRASGRDCYPVLRAGARAGLVCLVCSLVMLSILSPYLGPFLLKSINSIDVEQKGSIFFIASSLMTCQGVGAIAYKVWYAQHRGYLSNILPALASLIGLFGLIVVSKIQTQYRLELSLIAFVGPAALLAILPLLSMSISKNQHQTLKNYKNPIKKVCSALKAGRKFLLFAVMSALVLQIDYVVISQYLQPSDAAIYFTYTKISSLGLFVYIAVLFSLWPIFSELIAKGKWQEIDKHIKLYSMVGIIFIGLYTISLALFMPNILLLLAPEAPLEYDINLILILGIYSIVRVWSDTHAVVLQSMGDMRQFWVFVPIQALISICAQILAVDLFGLKGIVIGLIISYVATVVWALPSRVRVLSLNKGKYDKA